MLRGAALERLRTLERDAGSRGVAFEMLGPPRLTKLLWESYLCGLLHPSVRALAESQAAELSRAAHARIERDATLRSHILSVGIPILTPDGERVYRGGQVAVPAEGGDGGAPWWAAPRGWGDLRPEQFATWIPRAGAVRGEAERRAGGP